MPTINEILLSNPRILYTGNQNFDSGTLVGVYVQLTGRYSNNIEDRHPILKNNLIMEGNLQSGGFSFGN